jgi:hypothetical protein
MPAPGRFIIITKYIMPTTELKPKTKAQYIWSVVITEYDDDYKHRGDDSAYSSSPKCFTTKNKAEKYAIKEMCDYISTNINDCEKSIPDNLKHYFTLENNKYCVKDQKLTMKDLDILHAEFCTGEFVPQTVDWSISKCKVE